MNHQFSKRGFRHFQQETPIPSVREKSNQLLAVEIKRAFDDENGWPGVTQDCPSIEGQRQTSQPTPKSQDYAKRIQK